VRRRGTVASGAKVIFEMGKKGVPDAAKGKVPGTLGFSRMVGEKNKPATKGAKNGKVSPGGKQ